MLTTTEDHQGRATAESAAVHGACEGFAERFTSIRHNIEQVIDGKVFSTALGVVKEAFYGFGDSQDFCDYNPET